MNHHLLHFVSVPLGITLQTRCDIKRIVLGTMALAMINNTTLLQMAKAFALPQFSVFRNMK